MYGNKIIGKLEKLIMVIDKDVEYDVIIGSGGKPFGQPIIKTTKYYGSFSKGMFKVSDLDKVLALHSVGNAHPDYRNSMLDFDKFIFDDNVNDPSNFKSSDVRKYIDDDRQSLTFFPIATNNYAIGFGGIVIGKHEYEVINNKFIRINAEFKGKFVEYYNNVTVNHIKSMISI